MTKKAEQVQTAFRLPKPLIARLDKLATRMSARGVQITRSDVARVTLSLGAAELEKEITRQEKRR